jgi:hypothetical protein
MTGRELKLIMNKILLSALFGAKFILLTGIASAQRGVGPPPSPPVLSTTLTPTLVSQYMYRGMRYGGASLQPNVDLHYGGLNAGFWGSFPLSNKAPGISDPELDLYGSYTRSLTATISVVPGVTWYYFPRAEAADGFYRQTFEPNLAFTYTADGFRLTPKVYYDIVREGFTAEVSAFYAYPLTRIGSELDFTAEVGTFEWRDAVKGTSSAIKRSGEYWSAGVAMPYQITSNGTVTLGFTYVKGTGNTLTPSPTPRRPLPAAMGRGVVSLSFSLSY